MVSPACTWTRTRSRPARPGKSPSSSTGNGGTYVDGGIIGPPPGSPGTTRLYLSGDHAGAIVDLFKGTGLDTRITAGPTTAASAVKMAYAAWTKGTAAMLLAARALARAEGVEEALLAEWALSQPNLADQSQRAAQSGVTKGWRWIAEMEEIAHSMAEAGLPDGFHQAAAEIYRRCPRLPGAADDDRPGQGPGRDHGLAPLARALRSGQAVGSSGGTFVMTVRQAADIADLAVRAGSACGTSWLRCRRASRRRRVPALGPDRPRQRPARGALDGKWAGWIRARARRVAAATV